MQAITVRNDIYDDEDISSKPQARYDLSVPHTEKERYRNREVFQGRKQHAGGAYISFAVSVFELQFYSLSE